MTAGPDALLTRNPCSANSAVTYVNVPATVFDCGALAPYVAQALQHQVARIRQMSTAVAAAVIETGHDLRAVQEQLKNRRQYCDWVTAECGFSLSSAYNAKERWHERW
jgi:hypothetical protein